LQTEQYSRLAERAAAESAHDPVSATIAYVRNSMVEPLSKTRTTQI
jgi:hypothetical protein